jgi:hypothetical protein
LADGFAAVTPGDDSAGFAVRRAVFPGATDRFVDRELGFRVGREQRLDAVAQFRVPSALAVEQGGALSRTRLHGEFEQAFFRHGGNPLPTTLARFGPAERQNCKNGRTRQPIPMRFRSPRRGWGPSSRGGCQ